QSAGSAPEHLTVQGNALFFTANDGLSGRELWTISTLSSAPTNVRDIAPGIASSNPDELRAVGSTLFFTADPGTRVRGLWKSQGTSSSTVEISAAPANSDELV